MTHYIGFDTIYRMFPVVVNYYLKLYNIRNRMVYDYSYHKVGTVVACI